MGGGGGGGDGGYAAQQAAQEAKKNASRSAINTMFGVGGGDPSAREQTYADVRQGTIDVNQKKLNEDRVSANRALKFALLRSGNEGGSLNIDEGAKAQKAYDKGALDITNQADAAALGAKTSDEKARLDLLSRVDAGMDQGSALAGAENALQTNADHALAGARGATIGNAFDNAGLLYQAQQVGAGNGDAINNFLRLKNGMPTISAPGSSSNANGNTIR